MSVLNETEFDYCLRFLDEWTPWQFGKVPCFCTKEAVGTLFPLVVLLSVTFAIKLLAVFEQGKVLKHEGLICCVAYLLSFAFLCMNLATAFLSYYNDRKLWCVMGNGGSSELLNRWWHIQMVLDALYNLSILTIKSSILALYFGVFTNNRLSVALRLRSGMGVLLIGNACVLCAWAATAWWFYINIYTLGMFDFDAELQWTSEELIGYLNAFTDLCLLAFPIYGTWDLKISRQKRIAMAFILFLGCTATLASISRGVTKTWSKDRHWHVAKRNFVKMLFQSLEVTLGYVCYSLPACHGYIKNSKRMQAFYRAVKAVWMKAILLGTNRRDVALEGGESQVELVSRQASFQTGV